MMGRRRRIRYIGESALALTETYPRGVLFVGRMREREGRIEPRIEGTAFLVTVQSSAFSHLYVVTAGHIVDGTAASFVRVPRTGQLEPLDLDVPEWLPHPRHDVAVAPIALPPDHNLVSTALSQFVDDEQWETDPEFSPELALGDAVYFIGLLGKVDAMTESNIPMVRAGTLGRLWQEQLPVRRTPVDAVKYITAHLIDCRSFGGFSGSPCYLQQGRAGVVQLPEGGGPAITTKYRTGLLGLIGGHFDDWMRTRSRSAAPDEVGGISDDIEAPVSTGVGYVIPAEFIREALMAKEFVDIRRLADEAVAAREVDAATMDSLAPEENPTEFERFEGLTRKLVNVPKKELDEKRKDGS